MIIFIIISNTHSKNTYTNKKPESLVLYELHGIPEDQVEDQFEFIHKVADMQPDSKTLSIYEGDKAVIQRLLQIPVQQPDFF